MRNFVTEQGLLDLGFNKIIIEDFEDISDNNYYYQYKLTKNRYDDLALLSYMDLKTKQLTVNLFPHELYFDNIEDVKTIIDTLKNGRERD